MDCARLEAEQLC